MRRKIQIMETWEIQNSDLPIPNSFIFLKAHETRKPAVRETRYLHGMVLILDELTPMFLLLLLGGSFRIICESFIPA